MRTFLVTGGAGFIGSHIAEALVARGDSVRVLDNLSTGSETNLAAFRDRIDFIKGDIVDPATVDRAVKGVECVFHEAALASVQWSIDALGQPRRLLHGHGKRAGCRPTIGRAARGLPLGRGLRRPAAEQQTGNRPGRSLSPYAAAKLASEHYCHAFSAAFSSIRSALRYFNVFGPRQDPRAPTRP